MFEIEKMEQEFDYSLVDNNTADFLRSCEYEMNGIAEDARVRFGGVLKKVQNRLSNHHDGTFVEWYESGGMSKHDVYYAMNVYEISANLENSKKDNFLNAPKSLQKEAMKKNAPEDLKQGVYDGDITTHKEYKNLLKQRDDLEQSKQQAESQAESERKERERLESELENQEPETVYPDDYDYYKGNYESAVSLRDQYKERMEEMRKELNKSSDSTKEDSSHLELLEEKEKSLKRKISAYEKIFDMQSNIEVVLSIVTPKINTLRTKDVRGEYQIIDDFESTLNEVIETCNSMKSKLPNKNIIEGEIIND